MLREGCSELGGENRLPFPGFPHAPSLCASPAVPSDFIRTGGRGRGTYSPSVSVFT